MQAPFPPTEANQDSAKNLAPSLSSPSSPWPSQPQLPSPPRTTPKPPPRACGSYLYEDAGEDLPSYTNYGPYDGAAPGAEAAKYTSYVSYEGAGTDEDPNEIVAYNNYGKYIGVGKDAPAGESAPALWSAYAKPPQGYGDYVRYKRGGEESEGG
ncbi:hypothetical protein B0T14DRAFT_500935 [Immersiella caudata]|uniref:Uncharacterized protein n=1 Tax=Immersiella caudata TaxID=314043 RepID=A0AA39U6A8_9PEZI|nr:hypothetical protein B0T14DRAFT_500935 [Immersiella caudata]